MSQENDLNLQQENINSTDNATASLFPNSTFEGENITDSEQNTELSNLFQDQTEKLDGNNTNDTKEISNLFNNSDNINLAAASSLFGDSSYSQNERQQTITSDQQHYNDNNENHVESYPNQTENNNFNNFQEQQQNFDQQPGTIQQQQQILQTPFNEQQQLQDHHTQQHHDLYQQEPSQNQCIQYQQPSQGQLIQHQQQPSQDQYSNQPQKMNLIQPQGQYVQQQDQFIQQQQPLQDQYSQQQQDLIQQPSQGQYIQQQSSQDQFIQQQQNLYQPKTAYNYSQPPQPSYQQYQQQYIPNNQYENSNQQQHQQIQSTQPPPPVTYGVFVPPQQAPQIPPPPSSHQQYGYSQQPTLNGSYNPPQISQQHQEQPKFPNYQNSPMKANIPPPPKGPSPTYFTPHSQNQQPYSPKRIFIPGASNMSPSTSASQINQQQGNYALPQQHSTPQKQNSAPTSYQQQQQQQQPAQSPRSPGTIKRIPVVVAPYIPGQTNPAVSVKPMQVSSQQNEQPTFTQPSPIYQQNPTESTASKFKPPPPMQPPQQFQPPPKISDNESIKFKPPPPIQPQPQPQQTQQPQFPQPPPLKQPPPLNQANISYQPNIPSNETSKFKAPPPINQPPPTHQPYVPASLQQPKKEEESKNQFQRPPPMPTVTPGQPTSSFQPPPQLPKAPPPVPVSGIYIPDQGRVQGGEKKEAPQETIPKPPHFTQPPPFTPPQGHTTSHYVPGQSRQLYVPGMKQPGEEKKEDEIEKVNLIDSKPFPTAPPPVLAPSLPGEPKTAFLKPPPMPAPLPVGVRVTGAKESVRQRTKTKKKKNVIREKNFQPSPIPHFQTPEAVAERGSAVPHSQTTGELSFEASEYEYEYVDESESSQSPFKKSISEPSSVVPLTEPFFSKRKPIVAFGFGGLLLLRSKTGRSRDEDGRKSSDSVDLLKIDELFEGDSIVEQLRTFGTLSDEDKFVESQIRYSEECQQKLLWAAARVFIEEERREDSKDRSKINTILQTFRENLKKEGTPESALITILNDKSENIEDNTETDTTNTEDNNEAEAANTDDVKENTEDNTETDAANTEDNNNTEAEKESIEGNTDDKNEGESDAGDENEMNDQIEIEEEEEDYGGCDLLEEVQKRIVESGEEAALRFAVRHELWPVALIISSSLSSESSQATISKYIKREVAAKGDSLSDLSTVLSVLAGVGSDRFSKSTWKATLKSILLHLTPVSQRTSLKKMTLMLERNELSSASLACRILSNLHLASKMKNSLNDFEFDCFVNSFVKKSPASPSVLQIATLFVSGKDKENFNLRLLYAGALADFGFSQKSKEEVDKIKEKVGKDSSSFVFACRLLNSLESLNEKVDEEAIKVVPLKKEDLPSQEKPKSPSGSNFFVPMAALIPGLSNSSNSTNNGLRNQPNIPPFHGSSPLTPTPSNSSANHPKFVSTTTAASSSSSSSSFYDANALSPKSSSPISLYPKTPAVGNVDAADSGEDSNKSENVNEKNAASDEEKAKAKSESQKEEEKPKRGWFSSLFSKLNPFSSSSKVVDLSEHDNGEMVWNGHRYVMKGHENDEDSKGIPPPPKGLAPASKAKSSPFPMSEPATEAALNQAAPPPAGPAAGEPSLPPPPAGGSVPPPPPGGPLSAPPIGAVAPVGRTRVSKRYVANF